MKCPKCGKEISDDSRFCEFCGAKVSKQRNFKVLWVVLLVLLGLSALGVGSFFVYDLNEQQEREVAEAKAAKAEAERSAEEARQKQLQAEEEAAMAQQAKLEAEKEKTRAEREADEMRRHNEEKLRAENKAHKEKEARKAALKAQGYVDLGLPSGTWWKNMNEEGFYTWEQAMAKFGNDMPSKEQLEELINSCQSSGKGVPVKYVGSNGNLITFPALGYRNCNGYVYDSGEFVGFWTSSLNRPGDPWYFISGSYTKRKGMGTDCCGLNVRLVKKI